MGVREELTKALKAVEMIYWAVVPKDDKQGTAAVNDAVVAIHRTFYALNIGELTRPYLDSVADRPPRRNAPGWTAPEFVYLGGTRESYDLYLINGADHPSVAARHGEWEGDYASLSVSVVEHSLTSAKTEDVVRGPLLSAYFMALHKNLLPKQPLT